MRPSVVLLGFVLGTASAILFSLVGVSIIYLVLGPRYPRLAYELGSLHIGLGFFAGLTLFAALSFYGVLKERRWGGVAVVPTFLLLVAIGWYYWPEA